MGYAKSSHSVFVATSVSSSTLACNFTIDYFSCSDMMQIVTCYCQNVVLDGEMLMIGTNPYQEGISFDRHPCLWCQFRALVAHHYVGFNGFGTASVANLMWRWSLSFRELGTERSGTRDRGAFHLTCAKRRTSAR